MHPGHLPCNKQTKLEFASTSLDNQRVAIPCTRLDLTIKVRVIPCHPILTAQTLDEIYSMQHTHGSVSNN